MMKIRPAFLLFVLAPAAAAQSPFLVEPCTRLRGIALGEEELVEVASGDFDDDGRADFVVRDSGGVLAVLFAHGDRQIGSLIDLPVAARGIATQRRAGRDGLFIATGSGVRHWEIDSLGAHQVDVVTTTAVDRVHYGHQESHVWGCLWTVLQGGGSVQGILVDPATGAQLVATAPLSVIGGVGVSQVADLDDDGIYEFAITMDGGCLVIDSTGAAVGCSLRVLSGSDKAEDRLTCAVDADGSQHVLWSEVDGASGKLHVIEEGTAAVVSYAAGARGAITAVRLDDDGLADVVLPGATDEEMRVLLARASGARYATGGSDDLTCSLQDFAISAASVSMAVGDLERDGDLDVVGVSGHSVYQLRNEEIRNDLYLPYVGDNAAVTIDQIENDLDVYIELDQPVTSPAVYDRVRIRFYRQSSSETRIERASAPIATLDEPLTGWPFTDSIELPLTSNARDLLYGEVELVKDATGGAPEVVYSSMVIVLTPKTALRDWALGRSTAEGNLWVISLVAEELGGDDGNGTHGSSAVPIIPRLPPPPPPF